jgi:hypothetical protein
LWGRTQIELKGSSLDEAQIAAVVDMLLKFDVIQDEAGGFYEFAGQASWVKLLTGVVGQLRWCPRRGWKVLGSRFRFAAPLPVAA